MATAALPTKTPPVLAWIRANLFSSIGNSITTLILLFLIYRLLSVALGWLIFDAVWDAPNMRGCQAAGSGACWAFIREKWRFIIFGRYPYEEQWRAALVTVMLFGLTGV